MIDWTSLSSYTINAYTYHLSHLVFAKIIHNLFLGEYLSENLAHSFSVNRAKKADEKVRKKVLFNASSKSLGRNSESISVKR